MSAVAPWFPDTFFRGAGANKNKTTRLSLTMVRTKPGRLDKRIGILGAVLSFLVALWVLFSPEGALRYYRIAQEEHALRAQNEALSEQNKELMKEIARLSNDPAYIEEVARKKYGYLKKNEILFEFKDRKKKRH